MPGTTKQQAEHKLVGTKRATRSRTALLVRKVQRKTAVKRKRRTLNGIPLRRKVIWVYDTTSPEFKTKVKAEAREIKAQDADRDGLEFIETVLADPDVQKWWR
jgi:hypothetical protein